MTVRSTVRSVIESTFFDILEEDMTGFLSVKNFGAKGDGRLLAGDIVSVVNSTTLSAEAGVFSAADIGKKAWSTTGVGGQPVPLGTVTAYAANAITLSVPNGSGPGPLQYFYIGTDDTAAIQACWAAAKAANKVMYIPTGVYFVNRQIASGSGNNLTYNYTGGVIGAGSGPTRLVMMPDFATTGADLSINGALINFASFGPLSVGGFSVDCGLGANPTDFSGRFVISLSITCMSPQPYGIIGKPFIRDLVLTNERNFTSALNLVGCAHVDMSDIMIYNSSYQGLSCNGCSGVINNFLASNGVSYAVVCVGGCDLTFSDALIDEHTYRGLVVDSNSRVNIRGNTTIYGGPIDPGQPIVEVSGNSLLEMTNVELRPYNVNSSQHQKQTPLKIDAGSTVRMAGCRLTSFPAAGAKCITGGGTAVDMGENTFIGTIDVTTKRKVAYQAGW